MIRWEVRGKTKGQEANIFKDNRTYSSQKAAKRALERMYMSIRADEFFIRKVEVITDSERLEWMISRSRLAVWSNGALTTLNHVRHPREAIDSAMREVGT